MIWIDFSGCLKWLLLTTPIGVTVGWKPTLRQVEIFISGCLKSEIKTMIAFFLLKNYTKI
ncbi:MAG: hypothetical protein J6M43_02630 [Neisseriaceae bacterium]|nr:hypothetical protein [Neisseriaceae bacterium]